MHHNSFRYGGFLNFVFSKFFLFNKFIFFFFFWLLCYSVVDSDGVGIGIVAPKFYIISVPESYQKIRNVPVPCQYFGHMYSFEFTFTDFLQENAYLFQIMQENQEQEGEMEKNNVNVDNIDNIDVDAVIAADFLYLPHCVTQMYHYLRYEAGFNTFSKTWEALALVQEEYLIPIIHWV